MSKQVATGRDRPETDRRKRVSRAAPLKAGSTRGVLERALFARLGKLLQLETQPSTSVDFAIAVAEGLEARAAEALVDAGLLERRELDALVPRRTLSHRRDQGQRLKRNESDTLARVAKTLALAEAVFGEPEREGRWLRAPKRGFKGRTPFEMLASSEGAQLVEEALIRIDEGYFA